MPQIPRNWPDIALKNNLRYESVRILIVDIRAMQDEILNDKVQCLVDFMKTLYEKGRNKFFKFLNRDMPFLSQDNVLIDRHHRYAALNTLINKDHVIPASLRVPMIEFLENAENVYNVFTNTESDSGTLFKNINDELVVIVKDGKYKCVSKIKDSKREQQKTWGHGAASTTPSTQQPPE